MNENADFFHSTINCCSTTHKSIILVGECGTKMSIFMHYTHTLWSNSIKLQLIDKNNNK